MATLSAAIGAAAKECKHLTFPFNGYISIGPSSTISVATNVVFVPDCTASTTATLSAQGVSCVTDSTNPFHASITPQAYATGAATVIAWMLVIMLLITPRTFFSGQAGETFTGLRGRRGLIGGARGGSSIIGIGSRPWLQKVAALTVAISLTIATADTFRVAQRQYASGVMDAEDLRHEVVSSTRIKVSRVVSDIFLWLAQIQTLIRLFPRHKEKVLIKWIGFAMIILDVTFSCLNTFISTNSKRDRRFVDAIPALNYLFQLALSMLYAAWVIYYAITKRRYAFYHKLMWNISVVALLSILSILTPVVFFITDISNSSVAGWGDYFRWVGAAASSVIVWEWVERIEALEREEKKDGILGREVFDGDEMLDLTPPDGVVRWPGGRRRFGRPGDDRGDHTGHATGTRERGLNALTRRVARMKPGNLLHARYNHEKQLQSQTDHGMQSDEKDLRSSDSSNIPPTSSGPDALEAPAIPQPIASPISRADTASAASTVYAVRYWPVGQSPPLLRQNTLPPRIWKNSDHGVRLPKQSTREPQHEISVRHSAADVENDEALPKDLTRVEQTQAEKIPDTQRGIVRHFPNLFKRHKALPPAEVINAQIIEPLQLSHNRKAQPGLKGSTRWDLKARFGNFAAERVDRVREGGAGRDEADLPVTIIPAMPRGRTWSPEDPVMLAANSMLIPAEAVPGPGIETITEIPESITGSEPPAPPQQHSTTLLAHSQTQIGQSEEHR